jgi:hypothetical protein
VVGETREANLFAQRCHFNFGEHCASEGRRAGMPAQWSLVAFHAGSLLCVDIRPSTSGSPPSVLADQHSVSPRPVRPLRSETCRSAEEIVDSIAEINRSIDIMLESLPKN